jgi:hypothetical protein
MAERVNINEYIKSYPEKTAPIAIELRNLILGTVPDFDEVTRWNNLTYGKGKMLLAIVIHKEHVNLEFANGRNLTETGYPLEGTGKNMRHIKIKNTPDLEKTNIRELILKSVELDKK